MALCIYLSGSYNVAVSQMSAVQFRLNDANLAHLHILFNVILSVIGIYDTFFLHISGFYEHSS